MDYCIYHSRDLDGFSSAAIVKRTWNKCELIGYDYGDELPEIPDGKNVIMVDISLAKKDKDKDNPMEFMIDLANRCNQLVWIDHHKSAILDYENSKDQFPDTFRAFVKSGVAACELTWETLNAGKKMPLAIKWLGIYDTFRKEEAGDTWDTGVMPFQYGLRVACNGPEEFPKELFDNNSSALIPYVEMGKIILKYNDQFNKNYAKSRQVIQFAGLNCVTMNTPMKASTSFDYAFSNTENDFMMAYNRTKDMWNISFYSDGDKVDCSLIAKHFGGGGHAGASGCMMDDKTLLGVLNGEFTEALF